MFKVEEQKWAGYQAIFAHVKARLQTSKNVQISDENCPVSYVIKPNSRAKTIYCQYVTPNLSLLASELRPSLTDKYLPIACADIGLYFNITCSAVTKMGTRLKQKLEEDGMLKDTMRRIEEGLSHVNG